MSAFKQQTQSIAHYLSMSTPVTYVDECTSRHPCNDQQRVELSPEPSSPGLSHCTTHTGIVSLLLEAGWRVAVAVGRETTIFYVEMILESDARWRA